MSDACLVQSCDIVLLRTSGLVKESYLETPGADCALFIAGSEVLKPVQNVVGSYSMPHVLCTLAYPCVNLPYLCG